jgi:PleD family two-component response regulator
MSVLARQTCKVGDKSFPVSFSTGLHTIGAPAGQVCFEDELRKAAALLSAARKAGKNRCVTTESHAKAA